MTEHEHHCGDYLVTGFPHGQASTVTLDVDPDSDHGGMIVVASRIKGIYDVLKNGSDSLTSEDTEDLLRLADHLHRVIQVLTAQEDSLLLELRERVAARRIATAWDTNHRAVLRRESRVREAHEQGLNSAAYAERHGDSEAAVIVNHLHTQG